MSKNKDTKNLESINSLTEINLERLVKDEYRAYQIYTLMDRAIPYLQDGLKPSQRRILFTLWKNRNKGLLKVTSATGLVLTLHPHGPASVESSIVNLAQDFTFSNNYPLIDKKGYFGERMETSAAAGRYIECRIGKVAEILLFDDLDQVNMVPNFDEKAEEPEAFLPKLPLMLLNGAEGIGTGFSSTIPSFHHKDIANSLVNYIKNGRIKKIKPFIRNYKEDLEFDAKGKIITRILIEEIDDDYIITELPRGYDASKIYKYLAKFIEKDYLKDFVDSSVDNQIYIQLIFKKGQKPDLEDVRQTLTAQGSWTPNYTLISERGVKIFQNAEEILKIFAEKRLAVVKRRYEIWALQAEERLKQNNEIIRFIEDKHYTKAEKSQNRTSFVEYLKKNKFVFGDYLADMAIYRMTKEEVAKRKLFIKDDNTKLKEYKRVAKSKELIKTKLCEELEDVSGQLSELFKKREKERKDLYKNLMKKKKKKK